MKRYEMAWKIAGSVAHPPYSGTMIVIADDDGDAVEKTRRKASRQMVVTVSEVNAEIVRAMKAGDL